jgi:hypothetical protein
VLQDHPKAIAAHRSFPAASERRRAVASTPSPSTRRDGVPLASSHCPVHRGLISLLDQAAPPRPWAIAGLTVCVVFSVFHFHLNSRNSNELIKFIENIIKLKNMNKFIYDYIE